MIIQQDLILLLRVLEGVIYLFRRSRADITHSNEDPVLKCESVVIDGKTIIAQHRAQAGYMLPANRTLGSAQPVVDCPGGQLRLLL